MTTLPQPTPVRLPRPITPTQLAIPTGMTAPPPSGISMTGSDIWRVLRSHLWLIVIMVVLGAVTGYFLNGYLAKHYSKYTATGLVAIHTIEEIPNAYGVARDADRNALGIEMLTQSRQIGHSSLLNKVLQNPDSELRTTTWLKQFLSTPSKNQADAQVDVAKAKEDLAENFSVSPIVNSRLISISFTYRIPADCKKVVEEIVDQYIQDQRQENENNLLDRSRLLENQKLGYESQLRTVSFQIREKTKALGGELTGMNRGGGMKHFELSTLKREQMQLAGDLSNLEASLKVFMAQVSEGRDPPQVEQTIRSDPEYINYGTRIDSAEMMLANNVGLGEGHHTVKQLRQQIEGFRVKRDQLREELRSNAVASIGDSLRGQIDPMKQRFTRVNAEIDAIQKEIIVDEQNYAFLEVLKEEERVLRDKLNEVNSNLERITSIVAPSDWANVQWATRPTIPETPTFPKLKTTMSMAIALALALSLGIAFLRELTDNTVRSPRDIARVGQINLLGMISHESDDPQAAGARLPLVIFDAPHSMLAEQFRQVRSRLQHAASLDTTRSILVTGASPGDGKTTIACNLAAGLALNGRRILLVDSNFRKPEMHKVFDLPNDIGFSDLLNSLDGFEETVRETQVPNLSVLTSGVKPSNPTELLESQLLIDFIERALEEYDHVIFDSGPLPLVSETIALAPRVDGVVTVVRARTNSRGLLQRVRDTLRQVKAEHLGVILNAVRVHGGGYYGRNIKTYYAYQNVPE